MGFLSGPLAIGSRLSSYEIESLLGQGGMGAVYRAMHVKLGRKAAIKVLASELSSDEQFVSRFFHEARIVNAVRHPNIVDIYDFIEQDNPRVIAYVMELVEGPSLGELLKTTGLTPIQAVHATMQIAGALDAVHALGVIHRDLKPDNVLVAAPLDSDFSAPSSVKVLDFGIAKVADPNRSHKTGTGFLLGTPPYMAPEQIGGERVTPAADVYAVGEMLFELLTGRRLFNGDMHIILRKKVTGELPDLSLPQKLPKRDEIQALITRCLATAPEMRPVMKEIIARLDETRARLSGEKPITAPGKSRAESAPTTPAIMRAPAAPERERADTAPRLLEASLVHPSAPPRKKSLMVTMVGAALGIALGIAIFFALSKEDDSVVVESMTPVEKVVEPPAPPAKVDPPPAVEAPAPSEKVKVKAAAATAKKKTKKTEPSKKSPAPIKKEELPTW